MTFRLAIELLDAAISAAHPVVGEYRRAPPITGATAVGNPSVTGHSYQLIKAWHGSAWTTQQAAQTARLGGVLQHVSCVSATLCEEVGYDYYPTAANSDVAISEAWTGNSWRGQVTPNP
ncbi:hypothetical protein EAS64_10735 [Trebonia kvetii]|uniref:Uncharacterized protein n=1 Tax=Trebonia kvetii TaxID=2480626 RepID=A0A6P2C6D9_9ACTN|nr:hypothetical protein [Trebonia kvetii]TVZ05083.1 hypothetical protein EAS64_10735 [Trebonia kvetii]